MTLISKLDQFIKLWKSQPMPDPNLFAIFGTDEARVKDAGLALSKKLSPADDEFGLETVDGNADNSDHASKIVGLTMQALQTLPFFGGEKVVWLQGANFFGDSVTGRAQATLGAVEELLKFIEAGVPSDVKFIITASEIDKRRSFYKKVNKLAKVTFYDKADISKDGWEMQVMDVASTRAAAMGLKMAHDALERFVLMVGADTRLLQSELEKLSLYVGDREATVDDVRAIITSTHTGVIFEIGDALARRNLPLCVELIDQQLRRGESAIGLLLAAIVPRVRSMLQARDITERHRIQAGRNFKGFEASVLRLPAAETAFLPRKKDGNISCYPLFLAAQQCGKFSAAELKHALDACLEANLRLVTTSLEPHLVLHQLVTRILHRPPAA